MAKYKVPNERHLKDKWIIQKLASDFELLDVWEYPICFKASESDSLFKFRKYAVEPTLKNAFNFSLTGLLFSLRSIIGKVFRLDKNVNNIPIPNCNEKSLAERMSEKERFLHSSELDIDLRTDNYFDFQTVYSMKNETINEIANATEHSLMHYSWKQQNEDCYIVRMASYVKHRNKYGKYYIWLIKPFKYWIVYPYLFDEYVRRWNEYKTTNAQQNV